MSATTTNNNQSKYIIIGVAVVVILALLPQLTVLSIIFSILGNQSQQKNAQQPKEIPFQALYQEVAGQYPSIPWNILAAIHFYSPEYEEHLKALSNFGPVSLKGKDSTILGYINHYANVNGTKYLGKPLDPLLVAAVITAESNWNPKATSEAKDKCGVGARGLMQVMPCHFANAGLSPDAGYDPETNIQFGTNILASYIKQLDGNIELGVAAYNAGVGGVQNAGYRIPRNGQTEHYVPKVMAYYHQFQNENQATPVANDNQKDDKNKVTLDTVKKWLEDKAKELSSLVRIQSDETKRNGTCIKEAQDLKTKGRTIGTFSIPLSCGIYLQAPDKYTSSKDTTWDYVEMVEKKANEYLGGNGSVAYGDLIMAGGTFPLPTTKNIGVPESRGSHFGCRSHPVDGVIKFHYGVDIPVPSNTDVISVADGKVIKVSNDNQIGYQVKIDHGSMNLTKNGQPTTAKVATRYLHMISVSVKVGQQVTKGQVIAKSGGDQGIRLSTGAHLHFEVYVNGAVVNPYPFLTGKDDNPNLSCKH